MKKWMLTKIVDLCGGVEGLIELALEWFNTNVLQKIRDKEEFAAYATDVAQFAAFLDGVITRHTKWMSEAKRDALVATNAAIRELSLALADCNVTKDEIDVIVDKVIAAVKAWKEAK